VVSTVSDQGSIAEAGRIHMKDVARQRSDFLVTPFIRPPESKPEWSNPREKPSCCLLQTEGKFTHSPS